MPTSWNCALLPLPDAGGVLTGLAAGGEAQRWRRFPASELPCWPAPRLPMSSPPGERSSSSSAVHVLIDTWPLKQTNLLNSLRCPEMLGDEVSPAAAGNAAGRYEDR